MADQHVSTDRQYVRETRTGGGSAFVFILGAVVAVLAIVALVLWNGFDVKAPPAGDAGNGSVSVTIETEESTQGSSPGSDESSAGEAVPETRTDMPADGGN